MLLQLVTCLLNMVLNHRYKWRHGSGCCNFNVNSDRLVSRWPVRANSKHVGIPLHALVHASMARQACRQTVL